MSLLIIMIALLYLWIQGFEDTGVENKKAFTEEELDNMLRDCVGRSRKECRQILNVYVSRGGDR